uniref:Uncharacterized protein n=1 Tax=Oryza sativa subsp. japonica TaxID=39947 RepID=Q75LP8_ORYSJ|nr:hypothetical protein [Oryza sativa Japonica Group]
MQRCEVGGGGGGRGNQSAAGAVGRGRGWECALGSDGSDWEEASVGSKRAASPKPEEETCAVGPTWGRMMATVEAAHNKARLRRRGGTWVAHSLEARRNSGGQESWKWKRSLVGQTIR